MPSTPSYTPINTSEVSLDKPFTAALAYRIAFNPISMFQGAPTAKAAGQGVWVEKSPGGGGGNQTGVITDNLDTGARLSPDGFGGVIWSTMKLRGLYSNTEVAGELVGASNVSLSAFVSPYHNITVGGKAIVTAESASLIRAFATIIFETTGSVTVELRKYRPGTGVYPIIASWSRVTGYPSPKQLTLIGWDDDHEDGDVYFLGINHANACTVNSFCLQLTTF